MSHIVSDLPLPRRSEQYDEASLLHLLIGVDVRPIFIMGDHRSGTTLLYRLLDATNAFNVMRAYHIYCYDDLLANHLYQRENDARAGMFAMLQAAGQHDRVLDGVPVTPDLPEEYGFALGASGFRLHITPHTLDRAREVFAKVQAVSDPDRPLLLKNPWDYFLNFMYVKQAFPTARFIFLHRDPIDVIDSQLRAVRASLATTSTYNAMIAQWYRRVYQRPLQRRLTGALFGQLLGVRLVGRHVVKASEYYLRHVGTLAASDYTTLRYEDLCADPTQAIGKAMDFLGVEPRRAVDFNAMLAPRQNRRLPEVARHEAGLRQRLAPYLATFGYA